MTQLQIKISDKTYANGLCAIRDLRFELESGQFCAIVGPSGAGKTTLLNIIAGLDEDVNGSVQASRARPRTGFMFQESRLLPWLSVRQNIEMVLNGLQDEQEREAARQRLPSLLAQVGLSDFGDAYPRQLSVGMQRRASLVRAFVIQPDLLLMDEPFQALDKPTAVQMRELLLELWRETQASVLFVTHGLREALLLADRVLFLSARPACIVLDHRVAIEREARAATINQLHDELLRAHPELLSGNISDS